MANEPASEQINALFGERFLMCNYFRPCLRSSDAIKNRVVFTAVLQIVPGDAMNYTIEGDIAPVETLRGQRGKLSLRRIGAGEICFRFGVSFGLHAQNGGSLKCCG